MEVVVAPHGFSLELLKSVAAGDITDVLSNRDLDLNITTQIHQIRFSFSSRGRFFCLPARSAHRARRRRSEASETSLPMSPAEFYIGSDAETEKNAAPEKTTCAWSGRSWTRNSDGAWQAGFTCQQSQKPHGPNAFTAEFAVPFLGRSEALLGYLEELASKLCHVGVAVQLVTPVWQEHWSLSSLKLCGNRESLQGLVEGSLPISLWCQKSSKFQVQFFYKKTDELGAAP